MSKVVDSVKKVNKILLTVITVIIYDILAIGCWFILYDLKYFKVWTYTLFLLHIVSILGCIVGYIAYRKKLLKVASYTGIISGIVGIIIPLSIFIILWQV